MRNKRKKIGYERRQPYFSRFNEINEFATFVVQGSRNAQHTRQLHSYESRRPTTRNCCSNSSQFRWRRGTLNYTFSNCIAWCEIAIDVIRDTCRGRIRQTTANNLRWCAFYWIHIDCWQYRVSVIARQSNRVDKWRTNAQGKFALYCRGKRFVSFDCICEFIEHETRADFEWRGFAHANTNLELCWTWPETHRIDSANKAFVI